MFPVPLYNLIVVKVFFGLHGVAASSLVVLYDLVLVSVGSLDEATKSFLHLLQCMHSHFRTARPRGSAPRSFRNLFLRGTQVISCIIGFL